MVRRPLERERVGLDGGRRTTQLMRDSLGGAQGPFRMFDRHRSISVLLVILIAACAAQRDGMVSRLQGSADSALADPPSPVSDSILSPTLIVFYSLSTMRDSSWRRWADTANDAADSLFFIFVSTVSHNIALADRTHTYLIQVPLDSSGIVLAAPERPPAIVFGTRSLKELMNMMMDYRRNVIMRHNSRRAA